MRPDKIIKTLERAGFEARYVGGCVRDTLLNRPIHDWDIASQALPEDVMHLFAALRPYRPQARHCDCPFRWRQRRGHDLPARRRISRWPPPRRSALCAQSRGRSGPPRFYDQCHGDGRKRRDHRSVWRTGRFDSPCDPLRRRPGNALPGGVHCGCCARTALPHSLAFHWTNRHRRRSAAARRSAPHFRVSACGRRQPKALLSGRPANTLGRMLAEGLLEACMQAENPPDFSGLSALPKTPEARSDSPQSRAARRSTRRCSACPRNSAAWSISRHRHGARTGRGQSGEAPDRGARLGNCAPAGKSAAHGRRPADRDARLSCASASAPACRHRRGFPHTLRQGRGADAAPAASIRAGSSRAEHQTAASSAAAPSLWQEENKIQG